MQAGLLKIVLGEVPKDPPPFISLLGYKSITFDAIAKKCNFQNLIYFLQIIKLLSKKCAKTKSVRNMINYKFLNKPLPGQIKICNKIFRNYILFKENWKCANSLLMHICAKKISSQNSAICFLLFKAFQSAIKSLNPMTGSGSKYRFSRVTEK